MRALPVLAAALCLAAGPALAQSASGLSSSPAPVTPGAGIPPATGGAGDHTGSITGTGQTKPPGAPVDDREGTNPELDQRSRELDRVIEKGICKGC